MYQGTRAVSAWCIIIRKALERVANLVVRILISLKVFKERMYLKSETVYSHGHAGRRYPQGEKNMFVKM